MLLYINAQLNLRIMKNMKPAPYQTIFLVISIFLSCHSHAGQTFETDTITLFNNGPVVNLFAFSRPDHITSKANSSSTFRAQYELTNYISSTVKSDDVFSIDGETLSLRHSYRYQLNEQVQLGFSIPWIRHSGGAADSFIYDFHDLLQLPQNGRTETNENTIRWRLLHRGESLIAIDDNLNGWGDLSITAQLTPQSKPSARWSFMTKLPTGRYEKQTGSERLDAGLSYSEMNPEWFAARNFLGEIDLAFWYGAGINYLGKLKQLKVLDQNPFAATFRAGFAYAPFNHWHLKTQLDSQTPLFDTEIRELGWFPIMISFASSHKLSSGNLLELVIIEDLRPRSAPDVIFQTNYQVTF